MPKFYHFLRATGWLLLTFGRAAWHFRMRGTKALNLPRELMLEPKESRRLKHYYYGTSYLATVMCSLRAIPRSGLETYLFTNLSALAYTFDDLVDVFRTEDDLGMLWQDNPEAYGAVADKRGLALHLLHNIYQAMPKQDLARFQSYMHRIFNLETAGRQHVGKSGIWDIEELGIGALERITAEKGGCSMLLFRSILAHPFSEAEETALYEFGYLIQLCDDIFDLWHDRQAGVVTIATLLAEQGDLTALSRRLDAQITATHQAFRQTPYLAAQVETVLYVIHYLISITRVCLQHYQDLVRTHGTLPLDNRTAIVVDMEYWPNRFRVIRYILRPLDKF